MMKMTFDEIAGKNGKNIVDYWIEHGLTENDLCCRECGKFMLDVEDLKDVGYNRTIKVEQLRLYRGKKNKQYVESEQNRWLVHGRTLSGKTHFRHLCWECFFKHLPEIEDIPKRARKSSWYKDVNNGILRPPATWASPSKYFSLLFDITNEELEHEHMKFDTASLESFKRRHGEKLGVERYEEYKKRQAYTCSKEYMMTEKGMSEKEWNEFNKNRACTKKNFINRYGKELGTKKWDAYCKNEAYAGCKLEYFIDKYGKDDGIKKYLEVNSMKALNLPNFIRKYGEEEGKKRYNRLNSKMYSEVSRGLFDEIQKRIGKFSKTARYGENEATIELFSDENNSRLCCPDYLNGKAIIEFNGDYWHMNPKYYKADDVASFLSGRTGKYSGDRACDIWNYDNAKINRLKELGYSVKTVWESEFYENKDSVIQECVDFVLWNM